MNEPRGERIGAIDAWMTICGPNTAARWPDPFWHISTLTTPAKASRPGCGILASRRQTPCRRASIGVR